MTKRSRDAYEPAMPIDQLVSMSSTLEIARDLSSEPEVLVVRDFTRDYVLTTTAATVRYDRALLEYALTHSMKSPTRRIFLSEGDARVIATDDTMLKSSPHYHTVVVERHFVVLRQGTCSEDHHPQACGATPSPCPALLRTRYPTIGHPEARG